VVNRVWNAFNRCETYRDHLLNAVLGIAGEAGEVADLVKKDLFHEEKDRRAQMVEEMGDLMFYQAKWFELTGISPEECLKNNHDKLFKRYEVRVNALGGNCE
jgi:NTP pyrophosphatase (non-canonical NTP hydrolase)